MAPSEATLSELISARSDGSLAGEAVERVLRAVRRHLAMHVAFVVLDAPTNLSAPFHVW
jgi:hypothetical protein